MQLWKQNTNVLHIMLQLLPSSSRSTLPALVPSVPGSSFPCCLKRRADEGGSGQQSRGRHMSFSQTDPSLVLTNLAVWEAACSHAHYITPISRTAHTHKCISRNVTSTHMHFFFFLQFCFSPGYRASFVPGPAGTRSGTSQIGIGTYLIRSGTSFVTIRICKQSFDAISRKSLVRLFC